MVKKKSFLDILAKPLIISTVVVYILQLASVFIRTGILSFGSLIKLSVWQDIVFPLASFGTGWLLAKYWHQPKPSVAGIVFAASAWLWMFLTGWMWASLFNIFLWGWWHNGSSLAVQLVSAYVIQLIITLFIFGKKTTVERIRTQLYVGFLTLSVLVLLAVTYMPSIPHILEFGSKATVPYGGFVYGMILLFFTFGQLIVLAISIIINTLMLRKFGTKTQQFMINNLFAFYTSIVAINLVVFMAYRTLHDTINAWIIVGSLILSVGLDVWAMLYFRHHLPLRKG